MQLCSLQLLYNSVRFEVRGSRLHVIKLPLCTVLWLVCFDYCNTMFHILNWADLDLSKLNCHDVHVDGSCFILYLTISENIWCLIWSFNWLSIQKTYFQVHILINTELHLLAALHNGLWFLSGVWLRWLHCPQTSTNWRPCIEENCGHQLWW